MLVSGGAETTVKVELMDSGDQSSWDSLVDMSYSYLFNLLLFLLFFFFLFLYH